MMPVHPGAAPGAAAAAAMPPHIQALLDIPEEAPPGAAHPGGVPSPRPAPPPAPPMAGAGAAAPTGPTTPQDPRMLSQQVDDMLQRDPEIAARIRAGIDAGLRSGEITQQELDMATQLTTIAANNPAMYPQARQYAIESGLADEVDLPPQYDEGLISVMLAILKSLQMNVSIAPQGQPGSQPGHPGHPGHPGQPGGAGVGLGAKPQMRFAMGGLVDPVENPGAVNKATMTPGLMPRAKDGIYTAELHHGEYVVPPEVVRAKGTDFFDKLTEAVQKKRAGIK